MIYIAFCEALAIWMELSRYFHEMKCVPAALNLRQDIPQIIRRIQTLSIDQSAIIHRL